MKTAALFVCLMLSRLLLFGQWTSDVSVNTPFMLKDGNQFVYSSVPDGAGGTISLWGDDSGSDSITFRNHLYLQRLSSQGFKQWSAGGSKVTDSENYISYGVLIADGTGGAFVSWVEAPGNIDSAANIYAQRLDGNGNRLWGNNGVLVCDSRQEQFSSSMVADGTGGVIITWVDNRNISDTSNQIYAQRLNGSGVPQWTANGVLISDLEGPFTGAGIYSSGSNSFTVVWAEDVEQAGLEGERLYWQKINVNSARQTASNVLILDLAPAVAEPQLAGAVPDPSGGFYLAITTNDNTSAHLYLQHVLNDGSKAFSATPFGFEVDPSIGKLTGVPGFSSVQYEIEMENDNAGGVVLAWTDTRSGQDGFFAQRFNSSGSRLWNENDVSVLPDATGFNGGMGLVRNASGDFVFLVSRQGSTPVTNSLYAQKINMAGALQFGDAGTVISTAASLKFGSIIASGDNVIAIWNDNRSSVQFDVYAQNIPPSAVLPVTFISFSVSALNQKVELKWRAVEVNNQYFIVERSADGNLFQPLGTVNGRAGTNNYLFYDFPAFNQAGDLYYRIKQVDNDGKFSYSPVQSLRLRGLSGSFSLYPNPVTDMLNIALDTSRAPLVYTLSDLAGRKLLDNVAAPGGASVQINLQSIPKGIYVLIVRSDGRSFSRRIIKE